MSEQVKVTIPSALKSNAVAVSLVQLAYSIAALEVPVFTPSVAVETLRKAKLDDHADTLEAVERAEWDKANDGAGSKALKTALNDGFVKLLADNGLNNGAGRKPSPTVADLSQAQREEIRNAIKAGKKIAEIADAYSVDGRKITMASVRKEFAGIITEKNG